MFVGHFAVALGAKRAAPALSLGALVAAAQLADLLWPVLVLTGVERVAVRPGATVVTPLDFLSYPWSHSLLALVVWGALAAVAAWRLAGSGRRAAVVVAAVVASHWLLDWITHRPDLPLVPGGARYGLELWSSRPGTMLVEGALFALGTVLYARSTTPRDRTGRWALVGFVAFLALVWVANLFGPPPPSSEAVAWTALSMWLLVAWAAWLDRHRAPVRG